MSTLYHSISSVKKKANNMINIKEGRFNCKIELKYSNIPFSFVTVKKNLVGAIKSTTEPPMLLPNELGNVAYISIKNYG